MPATQLDQIVSLCKRRGFVFPGSEIYGGLANTWDYGPLGVELKKNVKDLWWNHFVRKRQDMVGLDASILMNPRVWEASGHVANFSDPLVDSKSSKKRYRADKLIEEFSDERPVGWAGEKTAPDVLYEFLMKKNIPDPTTGDTGCWTEPRQFNLMFKTHQGVTEESSTEVYLRPETAQGIFVNFKSVQQTTRLRLPFGIAQIGKAFRNEITPGNFTFRTREFEQMEIEYFFDPDQVEWQTLYETWKNDSFEFIRDTLGISSEHLRFRDHEADELSHYSKGTTDIEYKFPFGWGELCAAVAYRTNYDLQQHQEYSKEKLGYRDPDSNLEIIPHVMEPSFGSDRIALAVLIDAYNEEQLDNDESRVVMKFKPTLAPVQVAILPLSKKEPLIAKAQEIYNQLSAVPGLRLDFDVTGSIGKRYRRQDEVGTPTCVTVDFGTIGEDAEQGETDTVTIRDRDTLKQQRLPIGELTEKIVHQLQ